jgi:hypothetical protein
MSANAEELLTASITVALLAEQWGLDHMNPNLLFREGSNGAFLSRKALIESLATQPKPLVCIATVSGESLILQAGPLTDADEMALRTESVEEDDDGGDVFDAILKQCNAAVGHLVDLHMGKRLLLRVPATSLAAWRREYLLPQLFTFKAFTADELRRAEGVCFVVFASAERPISDFIPWDEKADM